MTAEQTVYAVIDALEAVGVPYMVVGSFSSNYYGIPRSTKDADFVIELGSVSSSALQKALGPGFRLDPQMSFETVTGTSRLIITHVATAFKIELFLLSGDAHDRERFSRRTRQPMPGREAFVAAPEDVVVTKLRWSRGGNRSKDMDDVVNVLHVQGQHLDWDYIRRWCAVHNTVDLLDRAAAEAGER